MISIYLNDVVQQIEPNASVADLLMQAKIAAEHFAVAVNSELVTRTTYTQRKLSAGDRVDIIVPMQGG